MPDTSFDSQVVCKPQRRLGGIGQIVLSLTACALTSGDISAHFTEV